jgi:hypothetical protein
MDKPYVVNLERLRRVYDEDRAQAETPGHAQAVTRVVARIVQDVKIEARAGRFVLESDEPPARGGQGSAPTPLQYFAAGIAT